MHSPSIFIALSFIDLLSFLHLVPQCSTPGIRAQRGDPGAGHGLCFLLHSLEGIRSDVLRCWLTLLLPLLLPLLTLKLCGFIPPAEQLSLPKGQLARSIEKLSHAVRNGVSVSTEISIPVCTVVFRAGRIKPLCSHRTSLGHSSLPFGKWISSQESCLFLSSHLLRL